MNVARTPSGRQPLDQAGKPVPIDPPVGSYSDYIQHRHLLLLSPKADTHFTIPRRVEGWVNLAGWFRTEMVYLPVDSHPSPIQVLTGPAVEQLRCFNATRWRYAAPPLTLLLFDLWTLMLLCVGWSAECLMWAVNESCGVQRSTCRVGADCWTCWDWWQT